MSRSSSSSRSQQVASTGGTWSSHVQVIDLDDMAATFVPLSDDTFWTDIDNTDEEILKVTIYMNNLHSLIPQYPCHEFIVVKSNTFYWSFDKNMEGIYVQRSKHRSLVKDTFNRQNRCGTVRKERRDPNPQRGIEGDKIADIFTWIYLQNWTGRGYHVMESNCHYFASELFEAIAREHSRDLHHSMAEKRVNRYTATTSSNARWLISKLFNG